ncbi:hypothetical protein GCM10023321_31010 [Pseudonocardia eucalypti]|uniref:Uncharacterized protein n=1 Tax=Pseudonocardia eucalypti TaxID=648755 RepID=A0ABP9Q2W8_9PSEU|nr:hypothetical protein [Pseudonocardia eucalypti]
MNWWSRLGILALSGTVAATVCATLGPAMAESAEHGGPKAGPALLYADPASAPQLENTGVWKARPIGVCHSSAYRDGEYVHQGCVYDDEGGGNQYRWPLDTLLRNYTYPEDPAYRRNAADIVEVRVRPLADATAFRVTLNTMTDPELYGLTLALGDSEKPQAVPHGANTVMPAARFVTVHGTTGDIVDVNDGAKRPERPEVDVDRNRRQVEIRVPHSAWKPGGHERIAAAAGLWDRGTDHYLVPRTNADRTHPGGAVLGDAQPSAFFDAAFRFHEPFEAPYRNNDQRKAIAHGDLSPFSADVDFGKLDRGERDDSAIPDKGYVTRLFASRFEKAQGRRLPSDPGGPPPGSGTQQGGMQMGSGSGQKGRFSLQFGWPCRDDCVPDLPGRLQRYQVYVPEAPAPEHGYASLVWTNGYALRPGDDVAGPKDLYQQFAHRPGNPTMVIDVDARGNDEWGYGQAGAAIFEALADARRHYDLDPDRTAMGGFSSGAYMANKISLTFPDVFGRAFICDGLDVAPSFPGLNGLADTLVVGKLAVDTLTKHEPGSKLTPLLPSRRNQPVMEWSGLNDDFIPYNITSERGRAYAAGGYDYEFLSWAGYSAEHLAMCKNGMWGLATKWMGDGKRTLNPHHVTYVRNPLMDDPASGLVGDHAYWLSEISSRGRRTGTIDVVSHGRGLADAPVPAKRTEPGLADGSIMPVNPYVREYRHLADPVHAEERDELEIKATDIDAVTIDPDRAGVSCSARLHAKTNGPLAVTLRGCDRTEHFDGSGPAGAPYDPIDPLSGVAPPKGGPLPAESGNAPQAPLSDLPALRFPPNEANPKPKG